MRRTRFVSSLAFAFAALVPAAVLRAGDEVVDPAAALEAIRARNDLPGVAAIGLRDGKVRVLGAAGRRRADDPRPLTRTDLFHLGSCGKAMTATMIATLVEEGTLTWETTIAEALPDLAPEIHADFRPVTLLQLLQHRGGIAERKNPKLNALLMTDLARLSGSPREQRYDAVAIVLKDKATTPRGQSMEYSNYGYMTAAVMAEITTEQTWQELMKERVFKPLGMSSAGFALPGTKGQNDQPRGHRRVDDHWVPLEPGVDPDLPECIAPAGLIHCTLEDWGKFVQAHMDGENGKNGIVTAETFRLLHRPPDGEPKGLDAGYACGWGVTHRPWSKGLVFTHSGSNGAWYSVIWAAPSLNAAAMAVSNAGDGNVQAALDEAIVEVLSTMGVVPRAPAPVGSPNQNDH